MLTRHDKAKALTTPTSLFKTPAEVVSCGDLSKDEKTAVLDRITNEQCQILGAGPGEERSGRKGSVTSLSGVILRTIPVCNTQRKNTRAAH